MIRDSNRYRAHDVQPIATHGLRIEHGSGQEGVDAVPGVRPRSLSEILEDPTALNPPAVVIPHLAWRGRVTLLAAREKSGKSTLLAAGAAAVSRGGDTFLGQQTGAGDVLWWSADNEATGDLARRFVRFGANPDHTLVLEQRPKTLDDFARIVADGAYAAVFVDTMAAAAAGLIKDASSSTDWYVVMPIFTTIAREHDCAVVLVHHAAKSGDGYRDSTAIGAIVDQIVFVEEVATDPTARRLKVRGRCAHGEVTVRLVGDEYQTDEGLPSLDARMLDYVERNPGQSGNKIGRQLGARKEEALECVRRLAGARQIENRSASKAPAWYRVVPAVPSTTEPVPAVGGSGPPLWGTGNQQTTGTER